jgi:hypothetical protein
MCIFSEGFYKMGTAYIIELYWYSRQYYLLDEKRASLMQRVESITDSPFPDISLISDEIPILFCIDEREWRIVGTN